MLMNKFFDTRHRHDHNLQWMSFYYHSICLPWSSSIGQYLVALIAYGLSDCLFNLCTFLLQILLQQSSFVKSLVHWIICESWSVQHFFCRCCGSCIMPVGLGNEHCPPGPFKCPPLHGHPSSLSSLKSLLALFISYLHPCHLNAICGTDLLMSRIDPDPITDYPGSGKKKALLIAIKDNTKGLPKLHRAQPDAKDLQRLLIGT